MAQEMGRMTAELLPGLTVAEELTGRDLHPLRAAVRNGHSPRVRMLACAGQVADQRGTVVALGRPSGDVVEFIHVRMDRDGDVLPFAPHELHLLVALPKEQVRDGGEPGRARSLEHGHEVGDDDLAWSQRHRGHDEASVIETWWRYPSSGSAANSSQVVTTRPGRTGAGGLHPDSPSPAAVRVPSFARLAPRGAAGSPARRLAGRCSCSATSRSVSAASRSSAASARRSASA